jgi:hypothetical protein
VTEICILCHSYNEYVGNEKILELSQLIKETHHHTNKNDDCYYTMKIDSSGICFGSISLNIFDEDRILISSLYYVNSELVSLTRYNHKGMIKESINFANGVRNGLCIYYHPKGIPWIVRYYKNGVQEGNSIIYSRKGRIKS